MAKTVREATHALLARHGLTTIFGNPGSNELPFLAGLPDGFRYVLGLHEGAVIGMADGYAQATGRPVLVNLHAASGSGNAMGVLTNAVYSRTPLVILAGQQVREVIGLEAMLASVDAAQLTRPLTGFSAEPAYAGDVPRTLAQAVFEAQHGRRGPVYVSVPYDDWSAPAREDNSTLLARSVTVGRGLDSTAMERLITTVANAQRPVLVLGSDLDGKVDLTTLIGLAEALEAPVWAAPSLWRLPFPNRHRLFQGVLPAGVSSIATALRNHDLALVLGAPVFRYHQHEPGNYLPEQTTLIQVTDDIAAATRAPVGEALVADPSEIIQALATRFGAPTTLAQDPHRWTTPHSPPPSEADGVFNPAEVFATLREALPNDTIFVVESTSTNADWWSQADLREPGSYYFPASGGLGFGLPAAVGIALAQRDLTPHDRPRRVVGVIGDGSANYGIQALWTARQLNIPVTIIILRNGTYGALRWFAGMLNSPDAPGMDVPGLDFVSLAAGYRVPGAHVTSLRDLASRVGSTPDGPQLIQVDTTLTRPDGRPLNQE